MLNALPQCEQLLQPPFQGAFSFYCLFNEARASLSFPAMAFLVPSGPLLIKHSEDQLISLIARFINEAKPGAALALPAKAVLHKREDGRICMSRNGSLPMPLWEPLSHDIVAKVVRWSREDLQAA